MAEFVKVANTNEVAPGQARLVNIKGKEIALFNIEGTFFALENACTHEEGPLAEGEIEGHEVTCPWHGAKFDVRTGEVLCPPAYEDLQALQRARDRKRHRSRKLTPRADRPMRVFGRADSVSSCRATRFDGDLNGTFHRIFEGHLNSEQPVLVGRFGFVRL